MIVGFPGKSDEDFKESYRFISELDISYLHVFTYYERANTHAINLEEPVPMHTRRERNEMLKILSDKKKRHFYGQHIGSNRPVLFEHHKNEDYLTGFTDNYVKVLVPQSDELILPVDLKEVNTDGLMIAHLAIEV